MKLNNSIVYSKQCTTTYSYKGSFTCLANEMQISLENFLVHYAKFNMKIFYKKKNGTFYSKHSFNFALPKVILLLNNKKSLESIFRLVTEGICKEQGIKHVYKISTIYENPVYNYFNIDWNYHKLMPMKNLTYRLNEMQYTRYYNDTLFSI